MRACRFGWHALFVFCPSSMHLFKLSLLFLPCLAAHAANPIAVYTMPYPPLHLASSRSDLPGLGDELVQRAAHLAGLDVVIHTVPWPRAQQIAQREAQACLFPLTRLPARETQYQWLGQLASGRLQLYGWHDAPRLADTAAAASYRITVLAGSSAELRLQQHQLPYISTNQESDGLRLLQLGKADYWAVHDVVARYEARLSRFPLKAVASLGEANSWLACHRNTPKAQVQALQQAFLQLQAQGEAERIIRNYLGDTHDETKPAAE